MQAVDRLVSAGVSPDSAAEIAIWFVQNGDDTGLEDYVRQIESRYSNGSDMRPALLNNK